MMRVALGNHEENLGQGRVGAEDGKTKVDKEKGRKRKLTALETATALAKPPCSVRPLVCDILGNKTPSKYSLGTYLSLLSRAHPDL